jgi:acetyl esterase/lipase
MTSNVRMTRIDAELEAFIPLFPAAELTDPVTARKSLAELAAAAPAPDTMGMEIEDRTVPADPDVPVRIYRPHRAQGAIVWLHGGGFVMGDLETEHPWAVRVADGSGAMVVSVGYRRAPEYRFPAALDDAYAVLASAATLPARGSRPRWHCGLVTSRGRRSATSCSASPSSMTGRRRGRHGTSPRRPL